MKIGEIYESKTEGYGLNGRHRILWINESADVVMTIEVPTIQPGDVPFYFAGPKKRSMQALEAAMGAGDLLPATSRLRGIFAMSDSQIRKRYPGKDGADAPPLIVREKYHQAIKPVIDALKADRADFFEEEGLRRAVVDAEKQTKFTFKQLYNALHRYLSLGIGKNALLPLRFFCGAPGKERHSENSLGNTTLAHKAGLTKSKNYVWRSGDKEKIALCWRLFMNGKNSVEDAYDLTMGVYWSSGTRIKDGEDRPILLPFSERPSIAQFRDWGPKGDGNKQAWQTVLGPMDWELKYRAILGSELDGIGAVGHTAICDGTSCDDHLVTQTSRLQPIGSAVRQVINCAFTTAICGLHVGLEAPSEQIALLAVLDAATSNVDMARAYGVDLEEDDIPAVFFQKYLVDNGEFRTAHTMNVMTALDSALDYVAVARGDRKGSSEADHHSVHKLLDHKILGTTRGKRRARGEIKPALEACWTFPEYMRLLLMAVRYHNCEQRVEAFMNRHPFRSQMLKDGVPPIRKAIHQWAVSQGLIASPSFDIDMLRASLLPEMRAVVRENGVFLVRPDRGERNDIVVGHRFLGPIAAELSWLERARRRGAFIVKVRANPNKLDRIWHANEFGLHELTNVSNDLALVQTGTLYESLVLQDDSVVTRVLERDRTEQASADLTIGRTIANDEYKRQKQAEINALDKKPSKKSLTDDVREHRDAERMRLSGSTKDLEQNEQGRGSQSGATYPEAAERDAPIVDRMDVALEAHRKAGS